MKETKVAKNTKKAEKLTICYASDGGDFNRMDMSMWSLRRHIEDDVRVFVLTESYWPPVLRGVTYLSPTAPLREAGIFPQGWSRSRVFAQLYRLAIPLMREFDDVDRVVCLDNDTLVVSDDAAKALSAVDLGDYEVVGCNVSDTRLVRSKFVFENEVTRKTADALGKALRQHSDDEQVYLDRGIVIFNLRKIRENGLDWYRQRLMWFWEEILHGKMEFLDQDFINVMMDVNPSLGHECCKLIRHYGGDLKHAQYMDALQNGYYYHASAASSLPEGDIAGAKQLVVYMCHIFNNETLWRYRKLRDDVDGMGMDVVWLYSSRVQPFPTFPDDVVHCDVTDAELLSRHEWLAPEPHSEDMRFSAPCCAPLMMAEKFKDKGYDYIWYIEYDVCYSGNWADFFARMNKRPHDLVCARLGQSYDDPDWWWWNRTRRMRPFTSSFKSLNCICRLSTRMVSTLIDFYRRTQDEPHTFFEHAWADIAVHELSYYDLYESECARGYQVDPMSIPKALEMNKLHHAVKDNVRWSRFCVKGS